MLMYTRDLGLIHLLALPDIRCFTFADMPWYTKKIAAALFATPPSSTYEEVNIKTSYQPFQMLKSGFN